MQVQLRLREGEAIGRTLRVGTDKAMKTEEENADEENPKGRKKRGT